MASNPPPPEQPESTPPPSNPPSRPWPVDPRAEAPSPTQPASAPQAASAPTPRPATAPKPAPVAPRPRKLPFPLQDGETTVLVSNKHWMYLWPSISLRVLFALLPVVAIAWLLSAVGGFKGALEQIFWIVSAIWAIYWLVRVGLIWYAYHNDLWVITNQRIVDSFKPNPFNIRLSTADLVNVQDMTVHRSGILRTIFDYGDIVCQTAASNQDFRLVGIPKPREVQVIVDRERDRERLRST